MLMYFFFLNKCAIFKYWKSHYFTKKNQTPPNNVLQYRLCLETGLMNIPSYYQLYICWFSSSEMQVNSNMKIKIGLYNLMLLCHCTIHMLKPLTWLELNIYFDPVAMWPTTIIILFIAGLEWTTSVKSW